MMLFFILICCNLDQEKYWRLTELGRVAQWGNASTPDGTVPAIALSWALGPSLVTRLSVTFGPNKIKRSD